MADTLPNTKIARGVPVDLYAESGIDPSKRILVQNVGVCDVSLLTQADEPTKEDFNAAKQIVTRGQWVINDEGDSGAWAYCNNTDGLVNVRLR